MLRIISDLRLEICHDFRKFEVQPLKNLVIKKCVPFSVAVAAVVKPFTIDVGEDAAIRINKRIHSTDCNYYDIERLFLIFTFSRLISHIDV